MKKSSLLTFGLLLVLSSNHLFGFGELGHSAVGLIAQKNLSPKALKMIREMLPGAEDLAESALFPDQVRARKDYAAYAPFHFVEIRPKEGLLPARERKDDLAYISAMVDLHKTEGTGSGVLYKEYASADHILYEALEEVLKKSTDPDQLAIALRYYVHAVGDVHQPFHVGNGVDLGANACVVKFLNPAQALDPKTGKPLFDQGKAVHAVTETNLHTFWDELVFEPLKAEAAERAEAGTKRYYSYQDLVQRIESDRDSLLQGKNIDELVKASRFEIYYESRMAHMYPDDHLKSPVTDPKLRPYCKIRGSTAFDASKVPTLGKEYQAKALRLIEERVLLAGLRLAHALNEVAEQREKAGLKIGAKNSDEDPIKAFYQKVVKRPMPIKERETPPKKTESAGETRPTQKPETNPSAHVNP